MLPLACVLTYNCIIYVSPLFCILGCNIRLLKINLQFLVLRPYLLFKTLVKKITVVYTVKTDWLFLPQSC